MQRCAGVVGGKAEVINLDWRKDNFKYSKTSPIVHTCTAWTADTRKYWKILWPAASSDGNYLLPIPSSHFYCLKKYRKSNCLSLAVIYPVLLLHECSNILKANFALAYQVLLLMQALLCLVRQTICGPSLTQSTLPKSTWPTSGQCTWSSPKVSLSSGISR